jgi:Tfp pilus assembly ATPase PilU
MATLCPVTEDATEKLVMPAGTIKRIHVHQQIVRTNVKQGTDTPSVTVQWRGKSYKARDVIVRGESRVMQRMHAPLSCGARIWIETTEEIEIS